MATKLIADLQPGDQVVTSKTVKVAWTAQGGTKLCVVYDDAEDTMVTFDLTGDPSIEVADG